MTTKLFRRFAVALCALQLLAGCADLKELNDRMERAMWQQNPAGPFGVGMDMLAASQQIRAARGR